MAHFERFGSYLILALSPKEKFFGCHSSPQAKFAAIISVRRVDKTWSWQIMKGIRAFGTGFPRVIALGTWRYWKGKNFLAVYGKGPGYVITFKSSEFKQWIVTPRNSEAELQAMFQEFFPSDLTAF
jgi:hypothetical protein